ncbi:MAG: hypothetical protein GC189_04125 [Alphaproteobacteria bacterium]|nr:hypothetical protein [Alphaproteobacteria bacterium]
MQEINAQDSPRRWEWITLGAVIAVGLALRVYQLNAPLWFDEIVTVVEFVRAPFAQIAADYSTFNNHLFYSLQAKAATLLFGEAPWSVRLPAMLFGMGSIWLTWRIARRASTPAVALLAAALMAGSYHHIWFSQNARGYTELMFWSLAAYAVFSESFGSKSITRWSVFAACLAAAMYTHLTAAFFIAALGLTYCGMLAARWLFPAAAPASLQAPSDRWAQWAPMLGFVGGGVLTLILCAPALPQMTALVSAVDETSALDVMKEYQNPLWTLLEGLRTLGGGDPLIMFAAPLALVFMGLGAVRIWRREPAFVLVSILQVPVTLAALSAASMRIWPRFFFTELAFAFVLMACGALVVAEIVARFVKPLTPRLAFGLGAAAMVVASLVLAARNYAAPKQDFPGPIALLQRLGAPAQAVGAVGWGFVPYDIYFDTGWRSVEAAPDVAQLSNPETGLRWVVVAFPARAFREHPDVARLLESDFEEIAYFPGTLGDGGIFVFESKKAAARDGVNAPRP